ncbi:hypothetical protein AB1N83_011761 [Pleurotus pulmonarius]
MYTTDDEGDIFMSLLKTPPNGAVSLRALMGGPELELESIVQLVGARLLRYHARLSCASKRLVDFSSVPKRNSFAIRNSAASTMFGIIGTVYRRSESATPSNLPFARLIEECGLYLQFVIGNRFLTTLLGVEHLVQRIHLVMDGTVEGGPFKSMLQHAGSNALVPKETSSLKLHDEYLNRT